MRLEEGDVIVCNTNVFENLTYGKEYPVLYTRRVMIYREDDICILDDSDQKHWFGQIGQSECWDNWFVTKEYWERNENINSLLDE
jgi:hypothetical protein